MTQDASFAETEITFANGIGGEPLVIPSADPINYYDAISNAHAVSRQDITGKLFVPVGASGQVPCVIVVPGSLGVAPSHLAHAESLTNQGIAACVIDPFGARSVQSTVANQTQYSFAASAWDVLAASQHLANREDIDSGRIGAQGHSRGGSAVLTAANSLFANATGYQKLRAVYAAYPWCGHQFIEPNIGTTSVRAVIGDLDEWCLPQQVQGYIHALRLSGGDASCRIIANAHHSFDRDTPVEPIEDAAVAPGAPTCYISSDGAFIHPVSGEADSSLLDRDLMVYGMKTGHGKKGARIGSLEGQAQTFHEDMMQFWCEALSKS